MDKFEQYNLNLSGKQKDLVNNYLTKIKKFVEKHEIEKELFEDIEEMVFEKISFEKEISDLRIIQILKEVWEPEVIFSDYIESDKKNDWELIYEKLENSWWIRDNENAIFLWISKTLSKKIWISVLAIRVLIVLLCLFWWLSAWLYILAWILLPVKWVDYSWESTLSYFKSQLILVIQNGSLNLAKSFANLLTFITTKWFAFIKSIFKFIFENIFPIFRFIIFGIIWTIFCLWILWLLTIWSLYFTKFSIENIDFTSSLPDYFIYWIFFGILALFIFAIFSFLYGISKKVLNWYVLWIWWISFLLALFLWISTWFDLFQKYSFRNEFEQTVKTEISNTWSYVLDLSKFERSIHFDIWWNWSIKLETSTWNILKVDVKSIIFWNDEIYKNISSWFSDINISKNENNLKLNFKDNKVFSHKVPFSPIKKEITVYIPKETKLKLKWTNYYFQNAFLSNEFEKYRDYLPNYCDNREISFSESEKRFVCSPDESELKNAKQEYLKNYLIKNFDDFSPIKHKNEYKRNYYNEIWDYSDWNFGNSFFDSENDKKLFLNFSDRSLDVNASLNIEETQTWVTISDFKILNVNVEHNNFDEMYYEDISEINLFLKK